jgi:hypothetical protein
VSDQLIWLRPSGRDGDSGRRPLPVQLMLVLP